jgi:hypothetical protein
MALSNQILLDSPYADAKVELLKLFREGGGKKRKVLDHQRRRMGHAGAANEKSGETELAKQILLDSPYVNTKEQLRLFREAGGKNRKILRVATISVGLWVVPTEGKNWRHGDFDADTPR